MLSVIFILCMIIVILLLFYRIQIGYAVMIALHILIVPSVKYHIGPLEIYFTHITIASTWFAYIHYRLNKKIKTGIPLLSNVYGRMILAFFLVSLIVIPMSSGMSPVSQLKAIFMDYIIDLSLCYIAWHIYNTKKEFRYISSILIATLLITTVYGIYCYISVSNPYLAHVEEIFPTPRSLLSRIEEARLGLQTRVQSTMYHAITWGGACLIFFLIFLDKTLFKRRQKYMQPILLTLLMLNAIMSGSRSVLLGIMAGLAVYTLLAKRKKKRKIIRFMALGAILLVCVSLFTQSFDKYKGAIESTVFFWKEDASEEQEIKGSSVSMRTSQFEASLEMIKKSYIGGLGHGYVVEYQKKYGSHPVLFGFESIVFQKLVENGFLGFVIWLSLFYSLYRIPGRLRTSRKDTSVDIALVKGYVVAYLVFAIFTGFMNTFLLFIIGYVILMKNNIINYNTYIRRKLIIEEYREEERQNHEQQASA